jgi:hypothetical protein
MSIRFVNDRCRHCIFVQVNQIIYDVIESNDKIDLVIDVNTQMNSIICFNYVEKV